MMLHDSDAFDDVREPMFVKTTLIIFFTCNKVLKKIQVIGS